MVNDGNSFIQMQFFDKCFDWLKTNLFETTYKN